MARGYLGVMLVGLSLATGVTMAASYLPNGEEPKLFCYYSSFAQNRKGLGKFMPENIDTGLCTHVIFAFADLVKGSFLKPSSWNDLPNGKDKGLYARTQALKQSNPKLKVLLALGGWKIGSKPFIPMIGDVRKRRLFVRNVVRYLRKHGFDGLDMDWEFPGTRGSSADDKYKFTALIKELRMAFERESRQTGRERLLLTMAAAGGSYFIGLAYEPEKIVKYLDYILLMTYNYHGSWNDFTGHHSGLFPRADETGGEREWNQAWTIDYWVNKAGAPREKVIVGIATYGMTFTLADPKDHGLKAAAIGGGARGQYTGESGIMAYYEICQKLASSWNSVWVDEQKVPYAYSGSQWIGYDNIDSVTYKANYIRDQGLGGAFIWSVEMDDFRGTCGEGKYPLLGTIARVLRRPRAPPRTTTYRRAPTPRGGQVVPSGLSVVTSQQQETDLYPSDYGDYGYDSDSGYSAVESKNSRANKYEDMLMGYDEDVSYGRSSAGSRTYSSEVADGRSTDSDAYSYTDDMDFDDETFLNNQNPVDGYDLPPEEVTYRRPGTSVNDGTVYETGHSLVSTAALDNTYTNTDRYLEPVETQRRSYTRPLSPRRRSYSSLADFDDTSATQYSDTGRYLGNRGTDRSRARGAHSVQPSVRIDYEKDSYDEELTSDVPTRRKYTNPRNTREEAPPVDSGDKMDFVYGGQSLLPRDREQVQDFLDTADDSEMTRLLTGPHSRNIVGFEPQMYDTSRVAYREPGSIQAPERQPTTTLSRRRQYLKQGPGSAGENSPLDESPGHHIEGNSKLMRGNKQNTADGAYEPYTENFEENAIQTKASQNVGVLQSWQYYTPGTACTEAGLFPHPASCKQYYICVRHGARWYKFHLSCPKGLGFKPNRAVCDLLNDCADL